MNPLGVFVGGLHAGVGVLGEKPTLEAAKGILLSGDDLHNALSGCVIKWDNFVAKFHTDNRFELWMGLKRIDTGKWWIEKDNCWLKSKVITGGWKVSTRLVLEGDTIKWYDRDGTLEGKGIYTNINKKELDEDKVSATP